MIGREQEYTSFKFFVSLCLSISKGDIYSSKLKEQLRYIKTHWNSEEKELGAAKLASSSALGWIVLNLDI